MTTANRTPLTRDMMAARAASEFEDGWIVNLGIGIPTICSDFLPAGRRIILHAENGVIGYGRTASDDEAGPYVVNAGVLPVLLQPFAAIVHHADSFAIVRKGLLDVAVLGAYEVAANGDFANWKLAGKKGGGIGGAMDIAACAKRLFIILMHTGPGGAPRLIPRCSLPITAPGVVTRIFTELGVFEPAGDAFRVKEIAPGYSTEDVQKLTGAPLIPDKPLPHVGL